MNGKILDRAPALADVPKDAAIWAEVRLTRILSHYLLDAQGMAFQLMHTALTP